MVMINIWTIRFVKYVEFHVMEYKRVFKFCTKNYPVW